MTTAAAQRKLNWTNTIFLAVAHLAAIAGIVWMATGHFHWQTIVLAIVWLECCSISITAGYHRLFSHRAYKAAAWWRGFLLLFGAASVQNSALAWSKDHRCHHTFTDTDKDPYNAQEGFWWSHVGWVLYEGVEVEGAPRTTDLENDRLVMLQHKYYVPLAVLMGAVLPAALGGLWGDAIGGLLVAGFLRLVVQWHMTFTINSLAHMVGSQPYSTRNSSRDSWIIALISKGEGYHNFHHRFQADYRNGVRWWQFDPTKWLLWTFDKLGVVSDLRRTPKATIRRALDNPRTGTPGQPSDAAADAPAEVGAPTPVGSPVAHE